MPAHPMPSDPSAEPSTAMAPDVLQTPREWRDDGWTATVIKNEDDDGWAVSMTREGDAEPALIGPWTMGRDKKNPKPLDGAAFLTLVKTASEVLRRHEQQLHALLHRQVTVDAGSSRVTVALDITPDDDHPSAVLTARGDDGELIAQVAVPPDFRLTRSTAHDWMADGWRKPRR